MRFMIMMRCDKDYERGVPPDPRLMAAIEKYSAEATRAGVLLLSEGLHPTSRGARVRAAGGKLTVTDGPFAEVKEVIGGFAILRAESKDEAVELAKRFLKLHQSVLGPGYEGEAEVRQVFDPSDFGLGGGARQEGQQEERLATT